MKNITILVIFAILSGCAATGPIFSEKHISSETNGVIYIFRKNEHLLSARTAYFKLDGKPIAALDRNGYSVIEVEPGPHEITQIFGDFLNVDGMNEKVSHATLNVCAGCRQYVKLDIWGGFNVILWDLKILNREVAMNELSKARLQVFKGNK